MLTINENLQSLLGYYESILKNAKINGCKSNGIVKWEIDGLRDYLIEDITKCVHHKETFDKLKEIKGPTLYWITLECQTKKEDIIFAFKNYRLSGTARNTPVLKTVGDFNSDILYVGKVQSNFYGRVIQHLGFAKNRQTQGLQLFHWAKGKSLKLAIHYREFDSDLKPLMTAVEYGIAKQLKPLIGSHK